MPSVRIGPARACSSAVPVRPPPLRRRRAAVSVAGQTVGQGGVVKNKTNFPRTRVTSTRHCSTRQSPNTKYLRTWRALQLRTSLPSPLLQSFFGVDDVVVVVGSICMALDGHLTDCHRSCKKQGSLSFTTSLENCWPNIASGCN